MKVYESENIVCFDVDDTLVIWNVPPGEEGNTRVFDNFGFKEKLLPHRAHIKLLKQFKARGQFVIVWSQGGHQWASEVVKYLELTEYVDLIMAKPKWIVDDLPASAWTKRTYLDLEGNKMPLKDIEVVDWEDEPNNQE